MKKIISILLSTSVLFTVLCGVTASAENVTTGNPIAINENNTPRISTGENIKFFDDFMCIDNYDADITNVGKDSSSTIEHNSADETGLNENAYNKTGGSLKFNIGTPAAGVVAAGEQEIKYYSMINDGSLAYGISAENVNNASFVFWSKCDAPLTVVVALYHRWSGVRIVSHSMNISAGENIVEIPIANFELKDGLFDTTSNLAISQYRIYVTRTDLPGMSGTAYFDNIGVYLNQTNTNVQATHRDNIKVGHNFEDSPNPNTIGAYAGSIAFTETEILSKLPALSDHTWNFDACNEVSGSDTKWTAASSTLTLEEDSANVYGGTGKSLKWEHSYYKTIMCAESGLNVSDYDGIIVWIKSDQAMTIDLFGLVNGWSKTGSIERNINAGENVVVFDFKDMAGFSKVNAINQMQIRSKTNITGTMYIDSIGFYKEPSNCNAYGNKGNSIHYKNENVPNDIENAARFAYSTQRFDLNDANGTIWGDKATIAIWMKSSRAINVKLACDDGYQWASGKNRWLSDKSYFVPAGESILYVPLSDLTVIQYAAQEHREKVWDFISSPNFYVASATTAGNLDLYIDEIAVVNPIIGDVNDDRTVDLLDFIRLKKLQSLDATVTAPDYVKDVNADGNFDVTDVAKMKKFFLGTDSLANAPFTAVS